MVNKKRYSLMQPQPLSCLNELFMWEWSLGVSLSRIFTNLIIYPAALPATSGTLVSRIGRFSIPFHNSSEVPEILGFLSKLSDFKWSSDLPKDNEEMRVKV